MGTTAGNAWEAHGGLSAGQIKMTCTGRGQPQSSQAQQVVRQNRAPEVRGLTTTSCSQLQTAGTAAEMKAAAGLRWKTQCFDRSSTCDRFPVVSGEGSNSRKVVGNSWRRWLAVASQMEPLFRSSPSCKQSRYAINKGSVKTPTTGQRSMLAGHAGNNPAALKRKKR